MVIDVQTRSWWDPGGPTAVLPFPIANPDRPGVEPGVKDIRERTGAVLRGRFARIETAAEVVAVCTGALVLGTADCWAAG